MHPVDHSAKIDAQAEIPIVIRRVLHLSGDIDPGIIANDVDWTERAFRLIGCAHPCSPVGYVQFDRPDILSPIAKGGERGIERSFPDVGDDDFHPRIDERFRHAQADPAGCARDESHLVLEVLHSNISARCWTRERLRGRRRHLNFAEVMGQRASAAAFCC